MTHDETYMARALQLARLGEGFATPNPMVGAVIVADDRIIGEGFHRRCGGPHAEINAINSIKAGDIRLLPESTVYVTLEPCSHYGKTPPCAAKLIEKNVKRVVIGMKDPFPKVNGGGIKMLGEAGIETVCGVLEEQCRNLNRRFILAHAQRRPFIQLKWAQTADGFIGIQGSRLQISTPTSLVWMHRERAKADAIMVGTDTMIIDSPSLTCRLYPGSEKTRVTFDIHGRLTDMPDGWLIIKDTKSLKQTIEDLYSRHGITSLMVEGGSALLNSFIEEDLYDEIRVEYSPDCIHNGIPAPNLHATLREVENSSCGLNRIVLFRR